MLFSISSVEVKSKFQEISQKCRIARDRSPSESLGALNMSSNKGPSTIKQKFSGSAITLTTMDNDNSPHPMNTDIVEKYYA